MWWRGQEGDPTTERAIELSYILDHSEPFVYTHGPLSGNIGNTGQGEQAIWALAPVNEVGEGALGAGCLGVGVDLAFGAEPCPGKSGAQLVDWAIW